MRLSRLEQRIAEGQVGLIAQGRQLLVPGIHIAKLCEDLAGLVHAAAAHEGDAEIELRVTRPLGLSFPILQQGNRPIIFAAVDQQLRL